MASHWYVIPTKPQKERVVKQQAEIRGFTTYFPCLSVQPVNPRSHKTKPFFPGYLFIRADLQKAGKSTFQYMPFTHGLVCFGGEPARVPDSVIHVLQKKLENLQNERPGQAYGLKPGESVRICDGPFSGYEAIFDRCIQGVERVRVLLKMLCDKYVPVELEVTQVSKVGV